MQRVFFPPKKLLNTFGWVFSHPNLLAQPAGEVFAGAETFRLTATALHPFNPIFKELQIVIIRTVQ
jgi:hypothetical protein